MPQNPPHLSAHTDTCTPSIIHTPRHTPMSLLTEPQLLTHTEMSINLHTPIQTHAQSPTARLHAGTHMNTGMYMCEHSDPSAPSWEAGEGLFQASPQHFSLRSPLPLLLNGKRPSAKATHQAVSSSSFPGLCHSGHSQCESTMRLLGNMQVGEATR